MADSPSKDHVCGTPNAMCDTDCMEAAYTPPSSKDISKLLEEFERALKLWGDLGGSYADVIAARAALKAETERLHGEIFAMRSQRDEARAEVERLTHDVERLTASLTTEVNAHETAGCRYEAAVGQVCTKCGRIHDFGNERCAECQTPRLCGVERECLRNRYVRPAVETSAVYTQEALDAAHARTRDRLAKLKVEDPPEKASACPKCEAVRKLGLKSCFEHKQQVNRER